MDAYSALCLPVFWCYSTRPSASNADEISIVLDYSLISNKNITQMVNNTQDIKLHFENNEPVV